MKTTTKLIHGDARRLDSIPDSAIDLVVTSPPYPMIQMWDGMFQRQNDQVATELAAHEGARAFELMHEILDDAWRELYRVLKPGGVACINIGDATRSIDRDFRLYSNHSRVLSTLLSVGFVTLPDILWRKPTNAPNKFMGSGMLPVGAYVTYEHEYILIVRKGLRRHFGTAEQKAVRKQSAFFWEERNAWFSDVWLDIRGSGQELIDSTSRKRSAAFPFELAYRLVSMHSVKGDTVLDPFSGTGITSAAAMAAGRNSISIELDETLLPATRDLLHSLPQFANKHVRDRISQHIEFAKKRTEEVAPLKYLSRHYLFPVMTAQEQDILLSDITSVTSENGTLTATYDEQPQGEFVRKWTLEEVAEFSTNPRDLQVQLQL